MKAIVTLILIFLFSIFNLNSQYNITENNNLKDFYLNFTEVGLGSGFGSMGPVFKVKGSKYLYTMEQNSYYKKPDKKPDTICFGDFRNSSVDSIINIVKDIKDTLIYKLNPHIMSGSLIYITIKTKKINLSFELTNETDSIAKKIVEILNSNIPANKTKLYLFEH